MNIEKVFTVKQMADVCPAITEGQLRWWIFHADKNGFGDVMIKIGGRVFIDSEAFGSWLAKHKNKS